MFFAKTFSTAAAAMNHQGISFDMTKDPYKAGWSFFLVSAIFFSISSIIQWNRLGATWVVALDLLANALLFAGASFILQDPVGRNHQSTQLVLGSAICYMLESYFVWRYIGWHHISILFFASCLLFTIAAFHIYHNKDDLLDGHVDRTTALCLVFSGALYATSTFLSMRFHVAISTLCQCVGALFILGVGMAWLKDSVSGESLPLRPHSSSDQNHGKTEYV